MVRILYVGGTGEISHACVAASARQGHMVSVFNRGTTPGSLPESVELLQGDLGSAAPYTALQDREFDVVCQFLAFDTAAIKRDIETFEGRCKQYIFISTASAYQKPLTNHVITEDTPLGNPFWEYSRKKADCELLLMKSNLPMTIVRPSHTYRTRLPGTIIDGDHQAWRIKNELPIIVHGDGQSLWTLTHAEDFAAAFAQLCGNPATVGRTFHITDSQAHTWDTIIAAVGIALNKPPKILHVASEKLIQYKPEWTGPLLGDKSNSVVFDNQRVIDAVGGWECTVSLADGLQIAATFTEQRLQHYAPNPETDALVNRIVERESRL
ncbi:MAG: nucleoside-diphosphate-sugar epimerase [Candidatus Azotimanducaceae bacterium]